MESLRMLGTYGNPKTFVISNTRPIYPMCVGAGEFDYPALEDIQQSLKPGTSAIIALVEHEWVERVTQELKEHEGQLFRQALKADIASQLASSADADTSTD